MTINVFNCCTMMITELSTDYYFLKRILGCKENLKVDAKLRGRRIEQHKPLLGLRDGTDARKPLSALV